MATAVAGTVTLDPTAGHLFLAPYRWVTRTNNPSKTFTARLHRLFMPMAMCITTRTTLPIAMSLTPFRRLMVSWGMLPRAGMSVDIFRIQRWHLEFRLILDLPPSRRGLNRSKCELFGIEAVVHPNV